MTDSDPHYSDDNENEQLNTARAVSIVSSYYTIKDFQSNPAMESIEFLVGNSSVAKNFSTMLKDLKQSGMIATAKRSKYVSRFMPTLTSFRVAEDNGIVITVWKGQPHKPSRRFWLPGLLFSVTLVVVFVDGFFRSTDFSHFSGSDPVWLAGVYTLSLMGILGIHELGHMVAVKKYGIKATWPFFIPGIPMVFPTFGAMIVMRSGMTNRNVLFDVAIAGPIAGLIVTLIVSIYGASVSVMVPHGAQDHSSDFFLKPSLLMKATAFLAGKLVSGTALIMSPILYAAWIGFLITFLNLLPAWQLDGGHLARAALGTKWHRILTYTSVGILFGLQNYAMALLILLFSGRAPENTPLDDVTPLSARRKIFFAVALGLAVLCAPIPWPTF